MSLLASICVTVLIIKGSIFNPLRQVYPVLFHCPLCFGFWVGALVKLAILRDGLPPGVTTMGRAVLVDLCKMGAAGAITAVGALFVYEVLGLVESLWTWVDNEDAMKHGK
jgi:hypothetical protein